MVNKRRIRRKIILPSMLALAILVVAILSTNTLYAKSSSYSPIMIKYSQYFNLLESEEQDTSPDFQDEKNADRYALFAEKLNDLELAGKITESQKETFLDKYNEIQTAMQERGYNI